MPRASTINYALAATLIASGATMEQAAKECGAKSPASLRVGLNRRNVTMKAIKSSEGNMIRIRGVANSVLSQESERLKQDFAELLQAHVGKLKELKPSSNLKKAKQLAEVLKPLSDTAKTVHGWGTGDERGAISVGWMNAIDSNNPGDVGVTPQQIDVASEVVSEPSKTDS